tara:strand:- start:9163 stop:9741 length:579 start_codon:yes stop_codon:yes gene_type:complete
MKHNVKYYSGIGSRSTPEDILSWMEKIAQFLAKQGITLRSGHAEGADYAFELGAGHKAEIYLPWKRFNEELDLSQNHAAKNYIVPNFGEKHEKVLSQIHPLSMSLSQGVKKLHMRNINQVLGKDVGNPVLSDFLICWTPNGEESKKDCTVKTGGTATAIKLAELNGVPVFNLKNKTAKVRLRKFCEEKGIIK